MITKQQKRRLYKIHYNLRKKGNDVNGRGRQVTKRAKIVTDIEQRWLNELIGFQYCICDGLFTPPTFWRNRAQLN